MLMVSVCFGYKHRTFESSGRGQKLMKYQDSVCEWQPDQINTILREVTQLITRISTIGQTHSLELSKASYACPLTPLQPHILGAININRTSIAPFSFAGNQLYCIVFLSRIRIIRRRVAAILRHCNGPSLVEPQPKATCKEAYCITPKLAATLRKEAGIGLCKSLIERLQRCPFYMSSCH